MKFQGWLGPYCEQIMRPQRIYYRKKDLVPYEDSQSLQRQDFQLKNQSGKSIEVSRYYPKSGAQKSVVIYLHGNSGCRADFRHHIVRVVKENFDFVCFDFTGCGQSEGQIVTYGLLELQDLKTVINHLRYDLAYKQIFIWGRSMGAVTGLLYAVESIKVSAVVADSPFCSFHEAATHLAKQQMGIPGFLISIFLSIIERKIKDQVGVDLDEVDLNQKIKKVNCPVIFVTSHDDQVVPTQHSQRLFAQLHNNSQILYVKGKHNQIRSVNNVEQCLKFLKKYRKEQ